MQLPKTITIQMPDSDEQKLVSTEDYIRAKTKTLKEFGYETLTQNEVREQLTKILAKENLSVIGMFMKDDVVTD